MPFPGRNNRKRGRYQPRRGSGGGGKSVKGGRESGVGRYPAPAVPAAGDYAYLAHGIAYEPLFPHSERWREKSAACVLSLFWLGLLSVALVSRGGGRRGRDGGGRSGPPPLTHRERNRRTGAKASGAAELPVPDVAQSPPIRGQAGASGGKLPGVAASPSPSSKERYRQIFPLGATDSEVTRFVRARKGDIDAASLQFRRYLDWRRHHEEIELRLRTQAKGRSDRKGFLDAATLSKFDDWAMASAVALESEGYDPSLAARLPCVVFLDNDDDDDDDDDDAKYSGRNGWRASGGKNCSRVSGKRRNSSSSDAHHTAVPSSSRGSSTGFGVLRSTDGHRICHHLPARIDTALASGQVYALSLALYLERRLRRDDEEKITVFIDTRPGIGWANISVLSLVPFIKHASRLLNDLHPERLRQAVVFPVPSVMSFVWNRLVRPFVDPDTADKIRILGGTVKVTARAPKGIRRFLGEKNLVEMERRRIDFFSSSL